MSAAWFNEVAVHGDGEEQIELLKATFVKPVSEEVSEELLEKTFAEKDIDDVYQVKHYEPSHAEIERARKYAMMPLYTRSDIGFREVFHPTCTMVTYGSANGTRWNIRIILRLEYEGVDQKTFITFVDVTMSKTLSDAFPVNGTPFWVKESDIVHEFESMNFIPSIDEQDEKKTTESREMKKFKASFAKNAVRFENEVTQRVKEHMSDCSITVLDAADSNALLEQHSRTMADIYEVAFTYLPPDKLSTWYTEDRIPLPLYEKTTGKPTTEFACWVAESGSLNGTLWHLRFVVCIARQSGNTPAVITNLDALMFKHGIDTYTIEETPFMIPWVDLMEALLKAGYFLGTDPEDIKELQEQIDDIRLSEYLQRRHIKSQQRGRRRKEKRRQPSIMSDAEGPSQYALKPPPAARRRDADAEQLP